MSQTTLLILLILGGTLAVFGTAFLFFIAADMLDRAAKKRSLRKAYKMAMPTEVNEELLCKDGHEWEDAPSIDEKGQHVNISVCCKCGFIPSRQKMATPEAIYRLKEQNKAMAFEKKLIDDFSKNEEDALRTLFAEELKNGLDFKKIAQVYSYGQRLNDRFMLYRMGKLEEFLKSEQPHE